MSNDILTFRCIIRNAGGKNENILAFLSLLDKTYAGWIMLHQIVNKLDNDSKF